MGDGSVKFTWADLHRFVRPYVPGLCEYSDTFSGSSELPGRHGLALDLECAMKSALC
jgi:hypothetical protein